MKNNKSNKKEKLIKYTVRLLIALFILFMILFGFIKYSQWKEVKNIDQTLDEYESETENVYKEQVSDKYGGATPQETLQMYIVAIEDRDYELASKYFISSKQEEEFQEFEDSSASNEVIDGYVSKLKEALSKGGRYDADEDYFRFNGSVSLELLKYPNGTWKIIEI
ncbi:MAG: hypothetical protein WD471_00390 [Candidatus Paceibacterota bacterium]